MQTALTLHRIIATVSAETGISVADILSDSRLAPIVRARHSAMWICRYYTGARLQEIATAFRCKRHATVIHAVTAIDNLGRRDRELLGTLHRWGAELTA